MTRVIQRLEFHGDKGEPGYELKHPSRVVKHALSSNHEGEGFDQHTFTFFEGEKQVGILTVNAFPDGKNVIETVEVPASHRSRGIAKNLLEEARKTLGEVRHSEWQTADGDAWSQAVGGARNGKPEDWTTERRRGFFPGDDMSTAEDGMTAQYAEWVDIDKILPFREHRGDQHEGSEARIKEIQADLAPSGEGMREALMLSYSPGWHKASLGEGNHRLEAARRAGWKQVPVRAVIYSGPITKYSRFKDVGTPQPSPPHKSRHKDRWLDYFKPSEIFREVIDLEDSTLVMAVDDWKTDPFPLHTTAPDILNGTEPTPQKGSYGLNRRRMVAILRALHDHSEPQQQLMRGVYKRDKKPEEIKEEFAPDKVFTLGPRGFTTHEGTAKSFARLRTSSPWGTRILFELEPGSRGLPLETFGYDTYEDDRDDDSGEAERIVAGTFEVVSTAEEHTDDGVLYLHITIRQKESIKPPPGGFK